MFHDGSRWELLVIPFLFRFTPYTHSLDGGFLLLPTADTAVPAAVI